MRSTLTPQQQRTITKGIGGSSIANILGVGYGTPLDEYNNIIRPESRPDLSNNPSVRAGIYLEPVIRQMAGDVFGLKIRQCNITKYHPAYDFMRANIDGKIEGVDEGIEIKNRGFFQGAKYGAEGTDEVLDSELLQCLWYLMITGWQRWHLVVLIGGYDLRHFVVERDETLIQTITDKGREFWEQHVVPQIPPPPMTNKDLLSLYPQDAGTSIEATADILEIVEQLKAAKAESAELKGKTDALELALKTFMADNATLIGLDGKPIATWKTQTTNRIDTTSLKADAPDIAAKFTKTSESRVLRVK